MGGIGSGIRNRKTSTGDCRSLDIKSVKELLKYPNNTDSTITWENKSSISLKKENNNYIKLSYSHTVNGEKNDYNYSIGINYTNCNYGGQRAWIICPHCHERVTKLWLKRGVFYCRTCHNLNYFSSRISGDFTEIYNRKITMLQKKLKVERDVMQWYAPKPKGMHYKTYNNLMNELHNLQALQNNYFISKLLHGLVDISRV